MSEIAFIAGQATDTVIFDSSHPDICRSRITLITKETVVKIDGLAFRILSGWILLFGLASGVTLFAQDGKLKVDATPHEAYVFVDGRALGEASHGSFRLSSGDHKVGVYNYGYSSLTQNVSISAGTTTHLHVTLTAVQGTVGAPVG